MSSIGRRVSFRGANDLTLFFPPVVGFLAMSWHTNVNTDDSAIISTGLTILSMFVVGCWQTIDKGLNYHGMIVLPLIGLCLGFGVADAMAEALDGSQSPGREFYGQVMIIGMYCFAIPAMVGNLFFGFQQPAEWVPVEKRRRRIAWASLMIIFFMISVTIAGIAVI